MNKIETTKILAVLKAAYPSFYAKQSKDELGAIVNLWMDMFADEDYPTVATAVKAVIASSTDSFPPNIGQVKEQILKLTTPNMMTPAEAWNLVRKGIENSAYHSYEEWKKLPDICRELITPDAMYELAISPTYNPSVEGALFQRSYAIRLRERCDAMKLPSSIKRMLDTSVRQALDAPMQEYEEEYDYEY